MIAVLLGTVLRLIVSYVFHSLQNHDTIGWGVVGSYVLQGKNIYPYPAYEYHSFFPTFLYVDGLAKWLTRYQLPFMFTIKAICSLFDGANIYLVYLLSRKNRYITWLYALNPITIFIVAVHGQFESIPLFFLLLGVYLIDRKKPVWSGLALSAAVAFKTWPLLFAIPLLKRVWKWWYLLLIAVVPLIVVTVYMLLYHAKFIDIIHYALFYRGQTGNYGTGLLFHFLLNDSLSLKFFSNGFLLLFAAYSFYNTKKNAQDEILDQMLFFFILSPTMGLQWLMWMMPFMLLSLPRWYPVFLAFATLYIGNVNYFWIMKEKDPGIIKYMPLLGVLTWLSLILIALFRNLRIRPYIVVSDDNLPDDKKGEK